jgi:5-formyltetrahydrofolate cyclo-ligase
VTSQRSSLPGGATKRDLRTAIALHRGALSPEALSTAARRLCERAIRRPELAVATVALYVSFGTEPGTRPMLDALHERGTHVLLPVVGPDLALDWALYEGWQALRPGQYGIAEPTGPRLGCAALAQADVVLAPALSADQCGNRLGRGGGSYDRALPLRRPDVPVIVLLHAGELVDALPTQAHDVRVDAALCPDGFVPLAPA